MHCDEMSTKVNKVDLTCFGDRIYGLQEQHVELVDWSVVTQLEGVALKACI